MVTDNIFCDRKVFYKDIVFIHLFYLSEHQSANNNHLNKNLIIIIQWKIFRKIRIQKQSRIFKINKIMHIGHLEMAITECD